MTVAEINGRGESVPVFFEEKQKKRLATKSHRALSKKLICQCGSVKERKTLPYFFLGWQVPHLVNFLSPLSLWQPLHFS